MMGLGVGGAGKYVPPSRKVGFGGRGEAGPEMSGGGTMGEDHTKIRVTNISEDTTEGDLRDLFCAFGRINRWGGFWGGQGEGTDGNSSSRGKKIHSK